jgi:hypothetical protein
MSESSFEVFKEKMAAASAQIAAIKKEEGKQKKKEADLYKILVKFIKRSGKRELVLLISRALEQNIPANFVLAIILLGNEEIQKEVGDFMLLKTGGEGQNGDGETNKSTAITFFEDEDKTLPIKIKAEIDEWIKNMLFQAQEYPQKLMKTSFVETTRAEKEDNIVDESASKNKKTIKAILPKLIAFVIRDFLEANKIEEPYEKVSNFAFFIIRGILSKIKDSLDNRELIEQESKSTQE